VEDPSPGLADRLSRAALAAGSGPYRLGLAANLALYDWGLRARTAPALPVVSVGNLTLGGTGKSTTVTYLARRLQALGVAPGVVTRGYRRAAGADLLLAGGQPANGQPVSGASEQPVSAAEAGDEPAMLAALLPGVPIAVGKRRERALELLRTQTAAQVALLDDGFQYFRMARLVDLVLLDASRSGCGERLFPAGYLREPWSHLRRADQVWLTHTDRAAPGAVERLEALVRRYCRAGEAVLTRHRLTALRGPGGERRAPGELAGRRVLAVSGLGNPASFESSLQQAGAEVSSLRYPDHHSYTGADLERIAREQTARQAELVFLTAKDAVKLPHPIPFPAWVAECELEIVRGQEQVEDLLAQVGAAISMKGSSVSPAGR
jgi:tetraacyldisaccharide 4'-kinase